MAKGGGSGVQQVEQTSTNLPQYAEPYFHDIMQRAQGAMSQPYVPYQGQRIAGFTPLQQQAQAATGALETPGQIGTATQMTGLAGLGALSAGQYAPSGFYAPQIGQPNLQQYQMSMPQMLQGQGYTAPGMEAAQTGFAPDLQQFQMGPYERVGTEGFDYTAPQMGAAQTGFNPALERFQMATPDKFGVTSAGEYMSPYMQSVVDVQKRTAVEDAQKTQLAQDLGAARQGTYGGARQLLAATERERALGTQLGDIQAKGLQSAYENAQAQFERDRAAGMTAQQQNLQAALGVQQLGTQTGLQTALANLSSEQQTNVQNLAAQLQTQGMSADQALRAALANQQAGITTGQQNLSAQLQTQELGTRTGLESSLANLNAAQQSNVQNLSAQMQAMGYSADEAMRFALANQQAQMTTGQQNLSAMLGTQELGGRLGLEALLANQRTGLEAQQMAEQSRQFGANTGLQGYQQYLDAARTMGGLGEAQQNLDLSLLQAQGAAGREQQQLQQMRIDQQYADYLRQRDYPMEQLQQMNSLLRGYAATPSSTAITYAPPPSMGSQLFGAGLGAASMYKMGT